MAGLDKRLLKKCYSQKKAHGSSDSRKITILANANEQSEGRPEGPLAKLSTPTRPRLVLAFLKRALRVIRRKC